MKARLILLSLAWLAVFSLGVGAAIATMVLHEGVEREAQAHAKDTAIILSGKIDNFLNASRRAIDALATLPAMSHLLDTPIGDLAPTHRLLARYCRALEGEICYVMDHQGKTLAASNWLDATSLIGKNYAFRPYFRQAMAGERGYYMAVGVTTRVRGLYLSAPVLDSHGETAGVAAVKFGLEVLEKEFRQISSPVALVDEHDIVFASNQPGWLFHSLHPMTEAQRQKIAEAMHLGPTPLPSLHLTSRDDGSISLAASQKKYWLGEEPVPLLPGWRLLFLAPYMEDTLSRTIHQLGDWTTVLAVAVTFIALAVGWLFLLGRRDIQERHQAEMALAESRLLLKDVMDQQNDAVFRMLPDTTLTFCNAAFAHLLANPSLGEPLVLPPDEGQSLLAMVATLTPAAASQESRAGWLLPDGRHAHFLMRHRGFFDNMGRLTMVQGVWSDITLLIRQEERIRVLSRATEESPAIVVITNAQGEIDYVNKRFTEVTGYTREEVQGRQPSVLKSGRHHEAVYRQLWDTILAGEIWRGEFLNRRKDGSTYWANAAIAPITTAGGKITHFVGVQEEITLRKLTEAELLRAKEAAEQATRAKSAFLANMSHELRTPMNSIIGMTTLCLQTETTAKQRDYLEKIASASRILLAILNDILDFSKVEAGKLTLAAIPFSLSEVLANLASLIRIKAEEKGLAWVILQDPEVPDGLQGDPLRLEQVLINLAGNAVKFTDQGEVTLSVALVRQTDDQITLRFTVRDTGIGMNEKEVARLFQSFSQADGATTTRQYGGTGLGLAISQRLVDLMGGQIQVFSTPGQGSTFTFTVVFQTPAQGAVPSKLLHISPPRTTSPDLPNLTPLHGKRVLLVEDNRINQQVALEFLAKARMVATLAENGEEALQQLARATFDVVLMDVQMPVMDGLEATRRLRAHAPWRNLPVIAMTAHALVSDQQQCLAAGMNDHIGKPVDMEQLYGVLLTWLAGHEANHSPMALEPDEAGLPDWPELPGIDLAAGLAVVAGNGDLLLQLIRDFAKTHGQDGHLIQEALAVGEMEQARRLAHTLKAVAGHLGALELQQAAHVLDKQLLLNPTGVTAAKTAFDQALTTVCQGIAAWLARAPGHPNPTTPLSEEKGERLLSLLAPFLQRLRQQDLDAMESWPAVAECLQAAGHHKIAATVDQRMELLDFETAAQALEPVLAACAGVEKD